MNVHQFLAGLWLQATGAFQDYWTALLHPNFVRPGLIIFLPVLLYFAALWGKRQPSIRHSTLSPHSATFSWSALVALGYVALALCVINFNLALIGPLVPESIVKHLMNTRDICVMNDSSGSMTTPLLDGAKEIPDAQAQGANDPTGVTVNSGTNSNLFVGKGAQNQAPHPMTRAEGAQKAARFLIGQRMTSDPYNTDRFCLLRFDDDVYEMAPLTNDKVALMLRTAHITENVGGGTDFVVALQKAYDYLVFNSPPDATRVLVMNTDGYDSIDPEKRKDLIALYKEAHIKFYVIGLGEGWLPQADGTVLDLQKFADELHAADPTSGFVFRASNPGQMQKAMEAIDRQEKSQEVVEELQTDREVDYVFIFGSIACGLLFFGLSTVAGRIP